MMGWTEGGNDRAFPYPRAAQHANSPQRMTAEQLQRVIPIAATQTGNGLEITLLSLEVYMDGLILLYRVRPLRSRLQARAQAGILELTASDNLRNQYVSATTGARQNDEETRAEARLTPGLAAGVKTLIIGCRVIPWRDTGRDSTNASAFTFEVDLS
jgi:hypothetical protein